MLTEQVIITEAYSYPSCVCQKDERREAQGGGYRTLQFKAA